MKLPVFARTILLLAAVILFGVAAYAQTEEELKDAMVKGITLFKQERYAEAIPHLKMLVTAAPDVGNLRVAYGIALIANSKLVTDVTEAKKLSASALEQFQAAKRLGVKSAEVDNFIQILGGTVAETPGMTEAEKTYQKAEYEFARSNYDEALILYKKALELDPKLYDAALHAGDAYVSKQDWVNSELYYQKAIAIDPRRETAYRYSATPFMRQKKFDLARDRYVEAMIAEPYNDMAIRGITQWGSVTGTKFGHPEVKFPPDGDAKAPDKTADGAAQAWATYKRIKAEWVKSKFVATYPKESKYRHSLNEESEAIRGALRTAAEKKVIDPDLQLLQKLETAGMLESYILISNPDDGIVDDYGEYLIANRPKLRQYVLGYVIQK